MQINSKIHGVLNYKEEDEILFKKGILGFEKYRKFIIVESEEYYPFKILHSLEDLELSLILISPFDIEKDYEVELSERIIKDLSINNEEDVLLCTTITLNSNIDKITSNLSAPFVVNVKKGLGEQVILDNPKYKIKHPLKKEM